MQKMKNTGQILRSRKNGKSKYTAINNDILRSKTLTAQEKSILVHLLSLPEDWVVYKGLIWKEMNMGREQFNRNWKGLVDKGYVVSIRLIDRNTNLVVGWNHVVYEEPVLPDHCIDQDSDLLDFGQSENPYLNKVINEQSTELTKEIIKESNNNTKGEGVALDLEEAFEQVWKAYNGASTRQVGSKSEAKRKFLKLSKNELEALRVNLPIFIKSLVRGGKADFFPNLTTYLNQKRYLDEKPPVADKVAEFEKKHNNWFE